MSDYYRIDFQSIDEVLEYLDREPKAGAGSSSTGSEARDAWDLGLGFDGAMDAYTGGWAEGAQRAYALAETLRPKPRGGRKRVLERSVVGGIPNTGAYLAGHPKAMYRVKYENVSARPYVHLYLPIGYMGGIDANVAFDRGCAMVALIDALTEAGCRVKVTLLRTSYVRARGGSKTVRLVQRFMVKDYADVLDVDQIIFTAAHPAMFRRLCFAIQERCDNRTAVAATKGAYGYSCNPVPSEDCDDDSGVTQVVFPRLEDNHGTPESFLRQMVGSLPPNLQTEITGE